MTVVISQVLTGLTGAVNAVTTILTSGNLATIATNIAALTTQMSSMQASLDITNIRLNTLNGYMVHDAAGVAAWIADFDTKQVGNPANISTGFANTVTQVAIVSDKLVDTIAALNSLRDRIADSPGTLGALITAEGGDIEVAINAVKNILNPVGSTLGERVSLALDGIATSLDETQALIAPPGGSIAASITALTLGTGFTAVSTAINGLLTGMAGIGPAVGTDDIVVGLSALGALVAGAGNLADRVAPNGSSVSQHLADMLAQVTGGATSLGNLADMKVRLQALAEAMSIGGQSIFDKDTTESAFAQQAEAAWSNALKTQAVRLYGPNGKVFEIQDYGNPI